MVITNGFTYIAFLMCLAGCLLLLEKYSKWRIFNVVPALVFIYILKAKMKIFLKIFINRL